MTHTEQVIANALAFVAASRAARERDQERRAAWQRRIELTRPLPSYVRGHEVQLSLDLDQGRK